LFSIVPHQRRNSVAHGVERGEGRFRRWQWRVWRTHQMEKKILLRTCGFLTLSNACLGRVTVVRKFMLVNNFISYTFNTY
jgi:hypothetical protein